MIRFRKDIDDPTQHIYNLIPSKQYFVKGNISRNALINNFNPLEIRDDIGALWENYVISERMKKHEYLRQSVNSYFWRTYDKKEIDLVEECRGTLAGFEIKWKPGRVKPPKDWTAAYPDATFEIINQGNYLPFIQ